MASISFALGLLIIHILFTKFTISHSLTHFLSFINSNGYSSEQINSYINLDESDDLIISDGLDNSDDSDI